ncbi:beta-hexosaminidase [Burkholderia gladioli]|uniref:beta-hexosaminidase n=1 Tax=Burkholderia gladioli TaxID=28095 RepID=UPI0020C764F3|nr:beta-hexosaminidase [Burkholderia gladioli]
MPRTKLKAPFHLDAARRDTLGLRSVARYDRNTNRTATQIHVGKYLVRCRPIPDSLNTLYSILDGNEIAGMQMSIPSECDCVQAAKRLRDNKRAAGKAASMAIKKAKQSSNGHGRSVMENA